MEITNTAPRIIHLPASKDGKFASQMLLPGLNLVDDRYWDAIKNHPSVRKQLAGVGSMPPSLVEGQAKIPEVHGPMREPVEPPPKPKTTSKRKAAAVVETGEKSPLLEMTEDDAIEVIENEEELTRLQEYLL